MPGWCSHPPHRARAEPSARAAAGAAHLRGCGTLAASGLARRHAPSASQKRKSARLLAQRPERDAVSAYLEELLKERPYYSDLVTMAVDPGPRTNPR